MIDLPEQVERAIKARLLFRPGQRILVAVSGGVDSIALLHILHELSRESGWKLTAAHLNHQLRGSSSLADERLVRRTARDLKLPLVVARADVLGFSKRHKLSIEMAARKLRHDFLARAAVRRKIAGVALAHHIDDQIELFFLRLLRGTGSEGLAGMRWRKPSPSNPAVELVRPLLNCSKEALCEYAAQQRLRFREDCSNSSLEFQRNRVRHELLPLLRRKYQPGLNETILRLMDILAAESELVTATAEFWLLGALSAQSDVTGNPKTEPGGIALPKPRPAEWYAHLPVTPFEELPVAIQRRCIQLQLLDQGIVPSFDLVEHLRLQPLKPTNISMDRVKSLGQSVASQGTRGKSKASALRLLREKGGAVRLETMEPGPFRHESLQVKLQEGTGTVDWDGIKLAWRVCANKRVNLPNRAGRTEIFDADAIGPTVLIRHWQPGDRFQPIGMDRAVKLQDLFVNQKVPRADRHGLVVAANAQGDVFWVEGLRISERFKLTSSTIRRLHWAWQRL